MASTEPPDIRPIDASQCSAVWPLSIEAGWNQTVDDWRFMLGAGRAFGCRAADGRWEASALVLPVGRKVAWISMVLVTERRRRAGLGRTLLRRCIEEVRSDGAVAGVDATELGRPGYLPLGLSDLFAIPPSHLDPGRATPDATPPGVMLRPIAPGDLPQLALYDRPLTGLERPAILAHLAARQPGLAWIAENGAGKIAGFVLARDGRMATSIGP